MGIDWWQGDPFLSGRSDGDRALEDRLRRLESAAGLGDEAKQEGSGRRRKGA